MIEIVLAERCIGCDACIRVCPNDVFDADDDGIAVIARQSDCVTCYLCEAYCPADALYVSPLRGPDPSVDAGQVLGSGQLGSFRRALGWHAARPGALHVDPPSSALPPLRTSMESLVGDHRLK